MALSFGQFRRVIEDELADRRAAPDPTPEELAAIVTLEALLAGLPAGEGASNGVSY